MDFPKKTPEYEELKELSSDWGISYGPITSRRLGASLGVNLLGSGHKACSFDCPYCDLGTTKLKMAQIKKEIAYPSLGDVDAAIRADVVRLTQAGTPMDYITFVGNGEPTLYPEFSEAVDLVKKIRDELAPNTKLGVLSNGSTLDSAKVVRGLNKLDERMIKLDAGSEEMFKKVDAPLVRMTISKLIQGTKKLNDVVLQSMFLHGAIDNTQPGEIDEWIEVVGIIKPKMVHMFTLDRVPPTGGLKQVPSQRLKEISNLLQKRTHIKGLVFA